MTNANKEHKLQIQATHPAVFAELAESSIAREQQKQHKVQ